MDKGKEVVQTQKKQNGKAEKKKKGSKLEKKQGHSQRQ